jgi:hypothetical protein
VSPSLEPRIRQRLIKRGLDARPARIQVIRVLTPRARAGLTLAVLLALPLLVLWRPLARGETLYQEDLAAQYFPREALLRSTGLTGWNPHEFLGMGLASDPQTAAYEPVRAFARGIGLSERLGLVLFLGVYLLVATVGAWALAWRLGAGVAGAALAALAFVWGGMFIVRFHHPWMFASMALIPWAALAADRLAAGGRLRDALAIGAINACGALGGHPQVAYMVWLFVAAYVAQRTWSAAPPGTRARQLAARGLRLGAAVALFCGLLAGFYAPVIAHLLASARGAGEGLAFAGSFSWNPWDWLRLLGPDLYGNDLGGTHFGTRNYHEQTCYLGVAPLALFVLALGWRARAEARLAALALGFFALAAGRYLPPFYLAYALCPGFRLFRCACRYSWFFALCASMVAALTLTRIARGERPTDPDRTRRRLGRLLAGAAIILGAAAAGALAWPGMDRLTQPGAHLTTAWAAARAALLLLATRVILTAWLDGRLSPAASARAFVALTCLDLAAQWLPYRQSRPAADVLPAGEVVAALAAAAPGRVFVRAFTERGDADIVPLANWGEGAGFDDLRGYNQLAPPDTLALLARADTGGRTLTLPDALGGFDPDDWLLDLTGVTRIAARAGTWPPRWRALPLQAAGGGWEVRQRSTALPRAWLVAAVERRGDHEIFDRLPLIDPRRVALVATGAAPDMPTRATTDSAGTARLAAFAPDDVTLEIDAARPALALLGDRVDPDWSVEVDGSPRPLVRADGIFRAVEIPRGHHTVRFHYRTPGAIGWPITAATLAIVLLGALVAAARTFVTRWQDQNVVATASPVDRAKPGAPATAPASAPDR